MKNIYLKTNTYPETSWDKPKTLCIHLRCGGIMNPVYTIVTNMLITDNSPQRVARRWLDTRSKKLFYGGSAI